MRDKGPIKKRQEACAAEQMLRLAGDGPADDAAIASTPKRGKGERRSLVEGRNGIANCGSGQCRFEPRLRAQGLLQRRT